MRDRASLQRSTRLAWVALLAAASASCSSSGDEAAAPDGEPAAALRLRFPDHADRVLRSEETLALREAGFTLRAQGAWRTAEVVLPWDAGDAIRFRGLGDAEVHVREIGAVGKGAPAESAVAYRRKGGWSFWTARGGAVEEWLHLDAESVRADEAVAAWEVTGATVRQSGEAVEVVDERGVVRLSVTAPKAYAIGGREVETTLSGSGARIELRVSAGEEEMLIDPWWLPTGSMSFGRYLHSAERLSNGKVLVAGSYLDESRRAEVYDPATGTWTAAPPMSEGRRYSTATTLPNGKALVTGSVESGSAELYDPATNAWTTASPMSAGRYMQTATLLQNGKVLIAGGQDSSFSYLASAELYDPVMNTWTAALPTRTPRCLHTATLLENGKVLVAGGVGTDDAGTVIALDSVELYDPVANTWTEAPSLGTGRYQHTATRLVDGKVLVAGGYNPSIGAGPPLGSAELYDPATNSWTSAPSMGSRRRDHTATLLANGEVLVTGGTDEEAFSLASAELYDPVTNTWRAAPSMNEARIHHTATLLANGAVLVAGGAALSSTQYVFSMTSAELYTGDLPPSLGRACALPSDCESGFCADGVCCNAACDAGPCDTCAVTGGAALDGICARLTGPACDDGNACTQSDTCQSGVCVGADLVVCSALDECHSAGTCDRATGTCAQPVEPDGTPCPEGTCDAGRCVAAPNDGGGGTGGADVSSSSGTSPADIVVKGACGCGASGSPAVGGLWMGLAMVLMARRRRHEPRGQAVNLAD